MDKTQAYNASTKLIWQKTVLALAIIVSVTAFTSAPAHAGNCDYSWQTASDGSLCGGRAASEKPGGRLGGGWGN